MKKILSVMLAIICMLGVLSIVTPLTVDAAENEVMLIMELKVDKEIGEKGNEVMLTIFETSTYQMHEVMFYSTSNYRTKINVPEGTYMVEGIYVSGTIKDYNFTTPTINASGQTVNVSVTIGNGDWSGNTDNNVVSGTIDRDKTNELLEEDNQGTIDWDKVDKEVENIQEEVAEITTEAKQDTSTTTEEEIITEIPEKTTEEKEENSKSLLLTIIFVVIVLGGSFGFIIWKRHKQGIPLGFGEE